MAKRTPFWKKEIHRAGLTLSTTVRYTSNMASVTSAKTRKKTSKGYDHSTSQQCYGKLRDLLIYGQLPDGVRLSEVEWSERLGAHRGAIREAMAMLAQQGLLRRGERGGFFTPVLDARAREEICQTRMFLEGGAIRLIGANRLDAKALQPLAYLCDTMQHLFEAEVFLGFVEADRKFHATLVDLSGNQRLGMIYQLASLPVDSPLTMGSEKVKVEKMRKRLEDHKAIHRALVESRIDDALTVLQEHLHLEGMRLSPRFEEAVIAEYARHSSAEEA